MVEGVNEELQQALTNVINSMMNVAQDAYAFGVETLPRVVEQLLLYNLAIHSIILFVPTILFISVSFYTARGLIKIPPAEKSTAFYKWIAGYGGHNVTDLGALLVALSCISCIFFLLGLSSLNDFLKLILAPDVWLLEYATKFIK